jgi:hypothetical protein
MSDRAEQLTKKLRKGFGNVPPWKTTLTQTCLDAGDSEWDIKRMYCGMADDYNKFRPLARMVHRVCKKEIGELPGITENKIVDWIMLAHLTDAQIKVEYQLRFDKARPEVRRAKKLLVEMRRDLEDCHVVGELRILRWIEKGLSEEAVKDKYKWSIEEAKPVSRAEALQYRLQDELNHRPVASIPDLQNHFREDLDDDGIVGYYRERIPKPPVVGDASATGSLPAGAEN